MRLAVDGPNENLFLAVGGRPYFDRLVARFYEGVASDPVLRPLYPEDLTESVEHTAGFLAQFWGGGTTHYSDHRGHPRLAEPVFVAAAGQAVRLRQRNEVGHRNLRRAWLNGAAGHCRPPPGRG